MAVPNVVMFVGFLAFAGYPALVSIIGGILMRAVPFRHLSDPPLLMHTLTPEGSP